MKIEGTETGRYILPRRIYAEVKTPITYEVDFSEIERRLLVWYFEKKKTNNKSDRRAL